ncbi:hypothetical protein O5511_20570 [Escherichia coli]|nr:hypothetical protein [Escherichia coli]
MLGRRITGILRRTGWAKGEERGVFITTSGFAVVQARDFAPSVEGIMVLVDGNAWCTLMIENESRGFFTHVEGAETGYDLF